MVMRCIGFFFTVGGVDLLPLVPAVDLHWGRGKDVDCLCYYYYLLLSVLLQKLLPFIHCSLLLFLFFFFVCESGALYKCI